MKFSTLDVNLNKEQTIALDNLVNVLFELKIIESPEQVFPVESDDGDNSDEESELLIYDAFLESSTEIEVEEKKENKVIFIQDFSLPCLPLPVKQSSENVIDSVAAFEILQEILVGPELTDLQQIITEISQNLTKIEHQIYEPEALINLLLPSISELLRVKIADSKEDIVEAITPIVDHAIRSGVEQDKASMGNALASILPLAISEQIRVEQDSIVDALYPIIGNTIAKYMAQTINAINQKIEDTLSPEGIKRKVRAKLQGVSEAELILKEAIPFSIQAIFLIHKTSGLIISEVQSADVHQLESEMLAGMLTAIRSFANDCIMQSGTVSELDAIDYGTSKITLEVAGYCYLAIITQGDPSQIFIQDMRQTLGNIVKSYGELIENFDGDYATIPSSVGTFLENIKDKYCQKETKKNGSPVLLVLILTIFSIILLPFGIWQYRSGMIHAVENKITLNLAATPELAVYRLNVKEFQGKLKLTGKLPNQFLRHRAEQVAQAAASKWTIDNQILSVEVPADPILAAAEVQRVTKVLNQIDGITISTKYTVGKVSVEGSVSQDENVIAINQAFEQIPGVKSVSSALRVEPLHIETRFYFQPDSATLTEADLGEKVNTVKLFLNQHPNKQMNIIGYSYSATNAIVEQQLAMARAKAVQQALINQGIDPFRLHVVGSTSLPQGIDLTQPLWLKRCVTLEAITPVKESK